MAQRVFKKGSDESTPFTDQEIALNEAIVEAAKFWCGPNGMTSLVRWDEATQLHVVLDEVQEGLVQLRARIEARIVERRWEIETGGIVVDGATVATDDRSKLLLAEAERAGMSNPEYNAEWKTATGVWISFSSSQLVALKTAVFAHVTAAFAREKVLSESLATTADADLEAFAATVETFWPAV